MISLYTRSLAASLKVLCYLFLFCISVLLSALPESGTAQRASRLLFGRSAHWPAFDTVVAHLDIGVLGGLDYHLLDGRVRLGMCHG
jgi:hypothetical protein